MIVTKSSRGLENTLKNTIKKTRFIMFENCMIRSKDETGEIKYGQFTENFYSEPNAPNMDVVIMNSSLTYQSNPDNAMKEEEVYQLNIYYGFYVFKDLTRIHKDLKTKHEHLYHKLKAIMNRATDYINIVDYSYNVIYKPLNYKQILLETYTNNGKSLGGPLSYRQLVNKMIPIDAPLPQYYTLREQHAKDGTESKSMADLLYEKLTSVNFEPENFLTRTPVSHLMSTETQFSVSTLIIDDFSGMMQLMSKSEKQQFRADIYALLAEIKTSMMIYGFSKLIGLMTRKGHDIHQSYMFIELDHETIKESGIRLIESMDAIYESNYI